MDETPKTKTLCLEGEISRRSSGKFLRFILAVMGVLLLRALVLFLFTYILGFRRKGTITSDGSTLKVEMESFMLGRKVRTSMTHVPVRNIIYIRTDESAGVLPVLGATLGLVTGLLLGFIFLVEWSTTLLGIYIIIGFGCILAGIAIDLLVSFIVPRIRGRRSLSFATRTDIFRLTAVRGDQLASFMDAWSNLMIVK
jgi:hypothetical protein